MKTCKAWQKNMFCTTWNAYISKLFQQKLRPIAYIQWHRHSAVLLDASWIDRMDGIDNNEIKCCSVTRMEKFKSIWTHTYVVCVLLLLKWWLSTIAKKHVDFCRFCSVTPMALLKFMYILVFFDTFEMVTFKNSEKPERFFRFCSVTPMALLKFMHISRVFWHFWIHEIKKPVFS